MCIGLALTLGATNMLAQNVSPQVQRQLVKQMISDGHISQECVLEDGEANVLGVDLLYLNQDKQPEYYVYGKGCATVGATRPAAWIYLRVGRNYRKIWGGMDGEQSDIKILKTRTNGFLDLQTNMNSGGRTYTANYKYNGRHYLNTRHVNR
jgi:hypothetical protein